MPCVTLQESGLRPLRTVDERLMSYNIEMTEITGGTFWKAYTPAQIAGEEPFPAISDMRELAKLSQWYDPIDTANPQLLYLAKQLGPMWVRVSGSWATRTYYDFDGTGMPEGYQSALTRPQWASLIRFVDAAGAKLLISMANCDGLHSAEEPWNPSEAEKIFALSRELGHPIDAVEFANEPNMLEMTGFPAGYRLEHFQRDQELFHRWVRANHPDTLLVGPCTMGLAQAEGAEAETKSTAGLGAIFGVMVTTEQLLEANVEPLDIYSYHYYNGISERFASVMPQGHWQPEQALSEAYLALAGKAARDNLPLRDKYVPGGQMWVTESGDAGGGGDTWASTYLDVPRTLNELGEFCTITDGIIFHNTLASSDYGFLQHGSFVPRPNYFAVLLWTRLMGSTVYSSGVPLQEGAHVYCHSRKDGREGYAFLVINNAKTQPTSVQLPRPADLYLLAGQDGLRSPVMTLNGQALVLDGNGQLPALEGKAVPAGMAEVPPGCCAFFVL